MTQVLHDPAIAVATAPERGESLWRQHLADYFATPAAYVGLGLFLALSAVFWSAVCIIISGPIWTRGWPEWWNWWLNLPVWR